MPTQNQIFMRQAKSMLAGNWGYVALGCLIYEALLLLISTTTIGELLLYGPLTLGYIIYLMVICDFHNPDLNLLFKGFDRFVQSMVAGILISLAIGLGMLLLIVPGIIVGLGFSMTFFIMAENTSIAGVDAIQASWEMMKGYKWDLFCLTLRFFGWFVLCILTCGILYLWVCPYVTAAYLNFYRNLKQKSNPSSFYKY